MYTMLVIIVVGLVFAVASLSAVYAYGRFAERSRGEPSFCLPTGGRRTPVMEDLHKVLASPKGATGLAMVSSNLDAFAARSLSARRAGRSLDLMYHVWHSDLDGRLLAAPGLDRAGTDCLHACADGPRDLVDPKRGEAGREGFGESELLR
jgi:cardiolipin synthase C